MILVQLKALDKNKLPWTETRDSFAITSSFPHASAIYAYVSIIVSAPLTSIECFHQSLFICVLRLSPGVLWWTRRGRAKASDVCVLDYPCDILHFFTRRLLPIPSCEKSVEAKRLTGLICSQGSLTLDCLSQVLVCVRPVLVTVFVSCTLFADVYMSDMFYISLRRYIRRDAESYCENNITQGR